MNKQFKRKQLLQPIKWLGAFSIKRMTFIGFALVVIPLTLALLYSVNQVNALANQGTRAVFNVAELNLANRQLTLTRTKLERVASQYIILQDKDLLSSYQQQANLLTNDIIVLLKKQEDAPLNASTELLVDNISQISRYLVNTSLSELNIEQIKSLFQELQRANQEVILRSDELIRTQANSIQSNAQHINTTMLQSLIIIPITLFISGFFIMLITRPMKVLSRKIKRLEQGEFEQRIDIEGAPEIREIGDALELMRTRLHALELQKSSFIRHISHELKTPLAAIREGTELIYDNSVGKLNDDQQEIVNIIKHSVTRLQRLIEDLLDFNIVLDSTSLQDRQSIHINEIINEVLEQHKLDIKRKSITIHRDIQAITLVSNFKQLSVILDNLLSNAIKFSPINGNINIVCWLFKSDVLISVQDEGIGISHDLNDKIFDAFYQGPDPQNVNMKGSGLGLTIVKELLMRLNGSIVVNNESSSQDAKFLPNLTGTTFTISLPNATLNEGE